MRQGVQKFTFVLNPQDDVLDAFELRQAINMVFKEGRYQTNLHKIRFCEYNLFLVNLQSYNRE